ncbi:MAG: exo-alpha-sialidase [Clostridia bacterium]|nr:exo-alpha-sialidase [Clostridia bacterium]
MRRIQTGKIKSRLTAVALAAALALPLASCGGRPGPAGPADGAIVLPTDSEGSTIEMKEYAVTKTVADFKYGVAGPYDKYTKSTEEGWNYWLSRSFSRLAPEYSYTPNAEGSALEYKANCVWSDEGSDDDCNYVAIYPSAAARTDGRVESEFLFYIPCLNPEGTPISYGVYPREYENYLDLSEYDNLSFIFCAQSEQGADVSFEVYLKNHGSERYKVYEYSGRGGKMRIDIDLREIAKERRDRLESLTVVNVIRGMAGNDRILNCWYKLEAGAEKVFWEKTFRMSGVKVTSEYLGNMLYTMCGAYSATGFYDRSEGKYKVWYGAGVPEQQSTDNVYYIESTDPERGWSKPVRITTDGSTKGSLTDASGKLRGSSSPIGYGGDPAVVKVDGTYYMYFSGLEWDLDDGTYHHWNKIWLATSADGLNWTAYGAVVDTENGGSLGYGSGAPSVVYYDGKFYMYYYSQSHDVNYPDEPGGLVLKISDDGYHFGKAISIDRTMPSMEVKYVPELMKWIGCFYTEAGQYGADCKAGVRVAFSNDGIKWNFDFTDNSLIAQDLSLPLNHNPGFIGTELGHAGTTLYCNWGANDLPLTVNGYWFSSAQYDARQLEFSRITLS